MYEFHTPPILKQLIKEMLPKMSFKIAKTLVKLICNATKNMASRPELIAYRCLILPNPRDRINLEKNSFNDQMVT